jgi:hypothetical protein
MAKPQPSVPLALMVIVAGVAVMYYVLHLHGWSVNSPVTLAETYRNLSVVLRGVVVASLIATAWGTGAAINTLARQK